MESQHPTTSPPPEPDPPQPEGEPAPAPVEEAPKKKHSFWRELPVLVVIAFVVALLIKTFLLQAFYIPSASMEPTLVEGDRVLVEKVSDWWGEPTRGQVVVFEKEFAPAIVGGEDDPFWEDIVSALKGLFGFPTGGTQDFIKRVMAVGGDTIEGREGRVFVNGEVVEEPYLSDGTETSPFGPIDVPKDMIFVMGDNRGNSDDSRAFGPIPVDEVVGHAFLLLWPPADFSTL